MMVTLSRLPIMPNNLEKMIERSGLLKKHVAELRGMAPGSISRHISGANGLSLDDAEKYAQILKCKPQEILFANPPIPLLAVVQSWNEADWSDEEEFKQSILPYSSANGEHPKLCLSHLFDKPTVKKYKDRVCYMHDHYTTDTMAVLWDFNTDDVDDIMNEFFNGCIEIVNTAGMSRMTIDKECFGKFAYCYTSNHDLIRGLLYQSGRKKYKIESKHFGTHDNVDLLWACPIINLVVRPELRGVEWAEEKTDIIKKRMGFTKTVK